MRNKIRQILREEYHDKLYFVGDSPIHGKGVFALVDIPFETNIGLLHTILGDGGYEFTELGSKHNHNDYPNCYNKLIDNKRYLITLVDIKKGDELTTDYKLQPDLEQPQSEWY